MMLTPQTPSAAAVSHTASPQAALRDMMVNDVLHALQTQNALVLTGRQFPNTPATQTLALRIPDRARAAHAAGTPAPATPVWVTVQFDVMGQWNNLEIRSALDAPIKVQRQPAMLIPQMAPAFAQPMGHANAAAADWSGFHAGGTQPQDAQLPVPLTPGEWERLLLDDTEDMHMQDAPDTAHR